MKPSRSLIASTAVAAIVSIIGLAYAETSPTVPNDASAQARAAASAADTSTASLDTPAERR